LTTEETLDLPSDYVVR